MNIKQCDLLRGVQRHQGELLGAIQQVLESGWYILGKQCAAFEAAFATFCGTSHCIGVANGTDSIELILRALNIGPGDRVATVSHTAVATVCAVQRSGAIPVFVDIEESTFNMCPRSLEACLAKTENVRAVLGVHLYGHPIDVEAISSLCSARGIPFIEDCAQAHGASYRGKSVGSLGIAGSFSFYPTKNLGAIGDGGAVVTSHSALAEKIRELRQYGWRERYISEVPGINSRLDELQAAILSVRLRHLEADSRDRGQVAATYDRLLAGIPGVRIPAVAGWASHSYHQYVIRISNRAELQQRLAAAGIGTAVHYPVPVHLQPAYRHIALEVPLPHTENVCHDILSLPMFPGMTVPEAEFVANSIRRLLVA